MPVKFNNYRHSAPPSLAGTDKAAASKVAADATTKTTAKAEAPAAPKQPALSPDAKSKQMASRAFLGTNIRRDLEGKYRFDAKSAKWIREEAIMPDKEGVHGKSAKLGSKYAGEHDHATHLKGIGVPDKLADGSKLKTHYFNDQERMEKEVRLNSRGAFVDSKGKVMDTGKHSLIFAMDQKGKIYAADGDAHNDRLMANSTADKLKLLTKEQKMLMHHSSFLAGKDVATAGELKFSKGKLSTISNKSGHYLPGLETTAQALQSLKNKGVNLNDTKVQAQALINEGKDASGKEKHRLEKFSNYAGEVMAAHGNAEVLVKKKTMLADIAEAPAKMAAKLADKRANLAKLETKLKDFVQQQEEAGLMSKDIRANRRWRPDKG